MDYAIREMKKSKFYLLNDFVYEAIFIPEGMEPPPKSIIDTPELQVYVENFGMRHQDHALVAEVDGKIIGAVWVRVMKDCGHIDGETPSFTISLYQDYRGCGIGTAMMKAMLDLLKQRGCLRASLAVQKKNYAVKMYQTVGFQVVNENEEEYIMVCRLQ